jgi:hypothetical protein
MDSKDNILVPCMGCQTPISISTTLAPEVDGCVCCEVCFDNKTSCETCGQIEWQLL